MIMKLKTVYCRLNNFIQFLLALAYLPMEWVKKNIGISSKNSKDQKTHLAIVKDISEYLSENPEDLVMLLQRSKIYKKLKDYELALKDATKVIEIEATCKEAYEISIDCLIKLGELTEAEDLVEKLRSQNSELCNQSQVEATIKQQKKCIKEIYQDLEDKNFKECLKKVQEASKASPVSVELWIIRMQCFISLKRLDDAKKESMAINGLLKDDLKVFEAFKSYHEGDLKTSVTLFNEISRLIDKKIRILTDTERNANRLLDQVDDMVKRAVLGAPKKHLKNDSLTTKETTLLVAKAQSVSTGKVKPEIGVKPDVKSRSSISRVKQETKKDQLKNDIENVDSIPEEPKPGPFASSRDQLSQNNETEFEQSPEKSSPMQARSTDEEKEDLAGKLNESRDEDDENDTENRQEEITEQDVINDGSSRQDSLKAEDIEKNIHSEEFIAKPKEPDSDEKQEDVVSEADRKNDEANEEYKAQKYQEAFKLYSEAINLNPNSVEFLINRSECLMAMEDFDSASLDAHNAIRVDPKSWKGYLNAINCSLALGNINLAKRNIDKLKADNAGFDSVDYNEVPKLETLTQAHSKIEEYYESKNFKECLKNLEIAMKIAKSCVNYQNLKAECLIMLQRFKEANEIIDEALKRDIGNANIVFLQGLQLYLDGFPRKSIVKFEAALRMNSEHVKARKHRDAAKKLLELSTQASNFYKQKNFQEACRFYSMALKIEPEIAKGKFGMLLNRGCSYFKLGRFSEAFNDFSKALKINETHAKCLFKRAETHYKLREFEDCIIDCEESLRLENSDRTEKLIVDAKFSLQFAKKRSSYSILGVNSGSSNEEIKKAFRKLSLQFHSDKHPNATAIDKKKLERKFQEVKTAYEVLVASK